MAVELALKRLVDDALDNQSKRILIAVSTGVDSMVLLNLLLDYARDKKIEIGIAHVNHQLREESDEEESFIREYCNQRSLPFYSSRWMPTSKGVEVNARNYRYGFFRQIMIREQYDTLVTAHHSDDQIETMLMKMIREGEWSSVKGIVQKQPFLENKLLVRPLLKASKSMIYAYAEQQSIVFFEDQTNMSDHYFRNRIRHRVVPLIKEENRRAAEHFQQISEQLLMNERVLEELVWAKDKGNIQSNKSGWQLSVAVLQAFSYAHLSYFLSRAAKKFQIEIGCAVSKRQMDEIKKLILGEQPQWQVDLEKSWVVRQSYDLLIVERQSTDTTITPSIYQLSPGEAMYLAENQWVGLFDTESITVPTEISEWQEYRLTFTETLAHPLTIRKREPGDRLQLNTNLKKKVSRWLIDHKIPNDLRDSGWLATDLYKNALVFFPFIHSCLSIASETDKIRYVLLYKYQK